MAGYKNYNIEALTEKIMPRREKKRRNSEPTRDCGVEVLSGSVSDTDLVPPPAVDLQAVSIDSPTELGANFAGSTLDKMYIAGSSEMQYPFMENYVDTSVRQQLMLKARLNRHRRLKKPYELPWMYGLQQAALKRQNRHSMDSNMLQHLQHVTETHSGGRKKKLSLPILASQCSMAKSKSLDNIPANLVTIELERTEMEKVSGFFQNMHMTD